MKTRVQSLFVLAVLYVMMVLIPTASSAAESCNYYASPTGAGNGLSQSSPFKISNFWSVAKSGDTLCLLDAVYTGSASMIDPPENLKGVSGNPITIRAFNDGKVLIDGESSRMPISLYYNDWFVVEGVNACCSNWTVVETSRSNNNIIRRVAAWDAADKNTSIFGVHNSNNNVLEDVAGWGTARKIYQFSYGGNFTILRRAWGRWEYSSIIGPKETINTNYNSYNNTVENSIFTWASQASNLDQPYGILVGGRLDGDKNANTKILGTIAYILNSQRFEPRTLYLVTNNNEVEITNSVAYVQPSGHLSVKPFDLNSSGIVPPSLSANNLTSIGGAGSYIHSDWQPKNIVEGPDDSSVGSIFISAQGAEICKRYEGGSLTNEPLWPWPMNQRIIDAMLQSRRTPVNVTQTIEQLFGSIPDECRGTSAVVPVSPSSLQVIP